MRDRDVRSALHLKVLREHHGEANTLVLDEVGLRHGCCRVDIAVVNGSLHGYEIKSDADTLERLEGQIKIYGEVLDLATLVVGERHLQKALHVLPAWWGVKVATVGVRGAIHFDTYRRCELNPCLDPVAIAELLWKPEVSAILAMVGAPKEILKKARAHQYRCLAEMIELDHLRAITRQFLKSREGWRGQRPPSLCGDS